jgi:predicted ester cyclase
MPQEILLTTHALIVKGLRSSQYVDGRLHVKRQRMSQDPKVLALKIMEELWNKKILALIDELFATNCVIHRPDGVLHGLEGAKQLYIAYVTSFPDGHVTVKDIVVVDDEVAIRYTFNGGHQGDRRDIKPIGKAGSVSGAVFFHCADGKVIKQEGAGTVWILCNNAL